MKKLINEIHDIKLYGRSLSYYKKNGIVCKYGDIIKINSCDLCPSSRIIIRCICDECQREFKLPFTQYFHSKGVYCSSKCKTKHTKLVLNEKYGVDNISKINNVKQAKERKSFEKYGVHNISQSSTIKLQKSNTTMKNFGVDNISKSDVIKQRKIETCNKNYGVDHPSQSKIILERYVKTIQDKYGIEFTNISQISEIMDKKLLTGICTKDFTLPSGKIVRIQGYENYGIEFLLNKGICEDDIIVGNKCIEKEIGMFMFYDSKKNKNRRYFPDIYVKSENKIYEIKSTYTINLNVELIDMKKQSVIDKGFKFEILVFNNKGININ